MDFVYPAGPAGPAAIPADLTKPTSAYRNRAWLAMGGLAAFVALYAALTGWFAWTAYRLLVVVFAGGDDALWSFIGGVCAAFLAIFMLKALFFVKHGEGSEHMEVTADEQPRLFAFLHKLADDAGAPRPHRVYLSGRVNAAVFYDLSIVNLLFPSKKNLEIGLALVNVLSLGEMKAVLAHEFGHFAQRTMAVGRWVYVAQQIAGAIIAKRDMLDTFLQRLSRIDVRIAWIGWILALTVWSIRSVMETVFRGVLLALHALSREMELQADLVAVSLTGSDALVHALHRLNVAEEAWDRALSFAGMEFQQGRRVKDLFAVQARVTERLGSVLGKPDYGKAPPLPADKREAHRVFKAQLAQPPRMWLTHPPSSEREENCKRRYISASIDERSAWELFDDVQALKERMSEHLLRAEVKGEPAAVEESLGKLDAQYQRAYLDRSYHGAYLWRSITRYSKEPGELYGTPPTPEGLVRELDSLYPETLASDLELQRALEEEKNSLVALRNGTLKAPNGIIRHRGKELKRGELPEAIEALQDEIAEVEQRLMNHDKRCRAAHLAAAERIGLGWKEYLSGLARVLHYADHAEANVNDARGYFANVWAIVTADGKVSQREIKHVVKAAEVLYRALAEVSEQREQVVLDRTLTGRLEVDSWSAAIPKLELHAPSLENIGDWLQHIDGYANAYLSWLSALRFGALEQLLLVESQVARFVRGGMTPREAAPASQTPAQYTVLVPGSERERQTKLGWWDRFQVADGTFATIVRLAIATGIVGAVFLIGETVGRSVR